VGRRRRAPGVRQPHRLVPDAAAGQAVHGDVTQGAAPYGQLALLAGCAARPRRARPQRSPWAGNSARVLHEVYLHCIERQEDVASQRIEDALDEDTSSSPPPQCVKAAGCTPPAPASSRPLYVRGPPPTAHAWAHELLLGKPKTGTACRPASRLFQQLRRHRPAPRATAGDGWIWPTHSPPATVGCDIAVSTWRSPWPGRPARWR
jgi:hypothetical protein